MYLEPRQRSKMEVFAQIVNRLKKRLRRGYKCASRRPFKVLYQKRSSEKCLFYKVARWSCDQISLVTLYSSFLVKLQGPSLLVYEQMNPSQSLFRDFDREIQSTNFLAAVKTVCLSLV